MDSDGFRCVGICTKNYQKLEVLKIALTAAWDNLDANYPRAVVDSHPKGLRPLLNQKEGYLKTANDMFL
ncbi:Transposase [Caenorhabditis elegans]|uniref:Transposase n=1 Tax=Caenorhabditis elegans TaxID=6239 RepID=Q9TXY3_CAEEL|nr:Transposase [Caenorhabditis elegans]CCD70101.1 Transposase [Caenorhabditis elegans]|eukprot:NP_493821.1 Uncharacterized protein CELE_F46F5.8 [Caenorhabditis elegans]